MFPQHVLSKLSLTRGPAPGPGSPAGTETHDLRQALSDVSDVKVNMRERRRLGEWGEDEGEEGGGRRGLREL
eukprot:763048-Hanusia_phi.AAC.1